MNKEKDTAIRMIYSSMAKIKTSKGTNILHQTIKVSKPYELPQGMDIEQACRVISYLSDKVESQNSYKPASEESVNGVLCQLERYGFNMRDHYPYGHIESSTFIRKDQPIELPVVCKELDGVVDLITAGGDLKLTYETDLNNRCTDWYSENISRKEIEETYNKLGIVVEENYKTK